MTELQKIAEKIKPNYVSPFDTYGRVQSILNDIETEMMALEMLRTSLATAEEHYKKAQLTAQFIAWDALELMATIKSKENYDEQCNFSGKTCERCGNEDNE